MSLVVTALRAVPPYCLIGLILVACHLEGEPTLQSTGLPEGAEARVGSDLLYSDEMKAVSATPGSERAQALVMDTLLAVESRAREPHRASVIERAVLARALRESIRRELRQSVPPTAADIQRALESNWLLYDRPRSVRAAVVRWVVPRLAREEPYAQEAQRVAETCRGLSVASAIVECVGEGEPRGEVLRAPPLDERGRRVPSYASDQTLPAPVGDFAQAIGRLEAPGATTPVHSGQEDYQVGIALDIIPADPVDTDAEREALIAGILSPQVTERVEVIASDGRSMVKRTHKDQAALLRLVWRQ